MNFLPEDYKIPKTPSGYMKFEDGVNSFRVLSQAVVGWVYFNKDKKPIRSKEAFDSRPDDLPLDGKIKPFWAFVVYNNDLKMIQILEITQKRIMNGIKALLDNPKWGKDPKRYDIAITKTGELLETDYNVNGEPPIAEPSAEIKALYKAKPINLEALFTNSDPFIKSTEIIIESGDMPA